MASESFKEIVDFALTDSGSQIRVENERKRLSDYQSGARHLNDTLTEWAGSGHLVPGHYRKAFVIPETKSLFTLGVGGDLATSGEVTKVEAVNIRTPENWTRDLEKVDFDTIVPNGYERTNYFFGVGTGIYGVSYDGDVARLVFPCDLKQGDVLVISYKSELGKVRPGDLTMDNLTNTLINLPTSHLMALRYGVAHKLAKQFGSPTRESLRMDYRRCLSLILMKNQTPPFIQYDKAVLRTGYLGLRNSSSPITEIGGVYQNDGSVVITEAHPHHPDYTDGTIHFGTIDEQGTDTQQGNGIVFRYGVLTDVMFDPPPAGTEYLYMQVPQGSEITSIIDERQVDVLLAWDQQGQQWRLGPLSPVAIGRMRHYKIIVRENA